MRLLIDENLSEALTVSLHDLFPDSLHIRTLGSGGASDLTVWELARQHDCILLTRDEDFLRLSILRGAPPKVILIRLGNCPTQDVVHLLILPRFPGHIASTRVSEPSTAFLALTGLVMLGAMSRRTLRRGVNTCSYRGFRMDFANSICRSSAPFDW
jgi:predicted nuclease of predicted toxin-antitoxin system